MPKLSKAGSVTKIPNTRYWRVTTQFYWWLNYETKDFKVIVPRGFKTDFGSIPLLAWWFVNPTGYNAFVLHDYMYSIEGPEKSRLVADKALLQALIVEELSVFRAYIVYRTVRMFGRKHYKNGLQNKSN